MTIDTPRWFTSSYSDNGGQCVQVATNLATTHGTVPVRDSKLDDGPVLDIPSPAFTSLVLGIKGGHFSGS